MFLFRDPKAKKDKNEKNDKNSPRSSPLDPPALPPPTNDFHKMRAQDSDSDDGVYAQNIHQLQMGCDMPILSGQRNALLNSPSDLQSIPPQPQSPQSKPISRPPPTSFQPPISPLPTKSQLPTQQLQQPWGDLQASTTTDSGVRTAGSVSITYPSEAENFQFQDSQTPDEYSNEAAEVRTINLSMGIDMQMARDREQSHFGGNKTSFSSQGRQQSCYSSHGDRDVHSSSDHESDTKSYSSHGPMRKAPSRRVQGIATTIMLPVEPNEDEIDFNSYQNLSPFPSVLPFRAEKKSSTASIGPVAQTVNHDQSDGDDTGSLYDPNTFRIPTLDMAFVRNPNDTPVLNLALSNTSTLSKTANTSRNNNNSHNSTKDKSGKKSPKSRSTLFNELAAEDSDQFDPPNFREKSAQDYNKSGVYARKPLQFFFQGSFIKTRPTFQTSLIHCASDVSIQIDAGLSSLSKLIRHFKVIKKAFAALAFNLTIDDSSDDSFSKGYTQFITDRTNWAKGLGETLKAAQLQSGRNFQLYTTNTDDKDSKDPMANIQDLPKSYLRTTQDRCEGYVSAMGKIQEITQSLASAADIFAKAVEVELYEPLVANFKELEMRRKKLTEEMTVLNDQLTKLRTLNRKLYRATSVARKHWEDASRHDENNDILYTELYYIHPRSTALPIGYAPRERLSQSRLVLNSQHHGDHQMDLSMQEPSRMTANQANIAHNSTADVFDDEPSNLRTSAIDHESSSRFSSANQDAFRNSGHSTNTPSLLYRDASYSGGGRTSFISPSQFGQFHFTQQVSGNNTNQAPQYIPGDRKSVKSALKESERRFTASIQASSHAFKELEQLQSERSTLASKLYFESFPQFLNRCEIIERDRLITTHTVLHRFHRIYSTFLYHQGVPKLDQSCSTLAQGIFEVISKNLCLLGPSALFGQYTTLLNTLSVDESLSTLIHDLQQSNPSSPLHFHTHLPCSPQLLQHNLLPSHLTQSSSDKHDKFDRHSTSSIRSEKHSNSNTKHDKQPNTTNKSDKPEKPSTSVNPTQEAVLFRRKYLHNVLTVETFDPINVDEVSIYQQSAMHRATASQQNRDYMYPQLPLFPRIYRVDQLYNESQWLRDQWVNIQNVQKEKLEDPKNENATLPSVIPSTAKMFNSIYMNGKNYSPFIVPQNAYVLALPDHYFRTSATHNRPFLPDCLNADNALMIHMNPKENTSNSTNNSCADGVPRLARVSSNTSLTQSTHSKCPSSERSIIGGGGGGGGATNLSLFPGQYNTQFQYEHLASAPHVQSDPIFNCYEDLSNIARYTFVELITVPGQLQSVHNHLNSLLSSGFLPISALNTLINPNQSNPNNTTNNMNNINNNNNNNIANSMLGQNPHLNSNPIFINSLPLSPTQNSNSGNVPLVIPASSNPNPYIVSSGFAYPPPAPPPSISVAVPTTSSLLHPTVITPVSPTNKHNHLSSTTTTTPLPPPPTIPPPNPPSSSQPSPPPTQQPQQQPPPSQTTQPFPTTSTTLQQGSPSRGYLPTHFLQPLGIDETSLALAQCLIYPRLSHAFSAFLRVNHAVENLQYWSDVRCFRTLPWQLENLQSALHQTSSNSLNHTLAPAITTSPGLNDEFTPGSATSNPAPVVAAPEIQFQSSSSRRAQASLPISPIAPGSPQQPFNSPTAAQGFSRHRRGNSIASYASNLVAQFTDTRDKDSTQDLPLPPPTATISTSIKRTTPHQASTSPLIQLLPHPYYPSTAFESISASTLSAQIPLIADQTLSSPSTNIFSRSAYRFSPEAFVERALLISARYLHESAHREVNVPGNMAKPLRTLLKLQEQEFISWKKQRINILLKWEAENPDADLSVVFDKITGIFGHITPFNQNLLSKQLSTESSSNNRASGRDQTTSQSVQPQPTLTQNPNPPTRLVAASPASAVNSTPLPIIPPLKLYIHRNIFVETEHEIYQLLSRDQFPRFKSEPQYSLCIQDFVRQILDRGW